MKLSKLILGILVISLLGACAVGNQVQQPTRTEYKKNKAAGENTLSVNPKDQQNEYDEIQQVFAKAKPQLWKKSLQEFETHMSKVTPGWSTEQLLRHAGDPDSILQNCWTYVSENPDLWGGEYLYYKFTMEATVVSKIDSGQGHISAEKVE